MADTDGAVERTDVGQTVAGRKVAGYCLAILSVATAVIHFAVAGEHFQEYWLFGVFMLTVAWLQLAGRDQDAALAALERRGHQRGDHHHLHRHQDRR
jgi:hypothetical protein